MSDLISEGRFHERVGAREARIDDHLTFLDPVVPGCSAVQCPRMGPTRASVSESGGVESSRVAFVWGSAPVEHCRGLDVD